MGAASGDARAVSGQTMRPMSQSTGPTPFVPIPFHILAISGSLRAASSNSILLRAAVALAPPGVHVSLYQGLGDLPHFNPDLDTDAPPPAVADFRAALRAADAVLICSPEYAHGVPGTLKNALDWVVGSGEFMDKPVALWNARPASTHAQAHLSETLTVMMATLSAEASIAIPVTSNKLDETSILENAELAAVLRTSIAALASAPGLAPHD